MGRLILHIGTHKTGTTSLQRGLARNRRKLQKNGIWYPNYDLIGWPPHYAHIGIANAFSGAHAALTRRDASQFFEKVAHRSKDFDATIISAEPFFRHIGLNDQGAQQRIPASCAEYWPTRDAYIRDLRDHFPVDEVEVVMVVRRQIEYSQSLYQEHIKTTEYQGSFADFRHRFWHRFDYLGQARAWAKAFEKLYVLRFEDLVAADNIVRGFGDGIGVALPKLRVGSSENVALPRDWVIWKRMQNGHVPQKNARKNFEALGKKRITRRLVQRLSQMPERSLFSDSADVASFYNQFVADNAALQQEFLPHLASDKPLFSDDIDDSLAFGDTLHPEFLHHLTTHLLSRK